MKKVLLINPSGDAPAWEKNILDRDDLRIFTATTAEEGLRIHHEEMVDLVITDLDLPDMGGEVLCSTIRQEHSLRKTSIIIVCKETPEEIRRARKCGANARLLKPVKSEQLDDSIGKLLAVSTRKDFRVLIRAEVYTERGMRVMVGRTLNISVSGFLMESDDNLAVGSRFPCNFRLPGEYQVLAFGEIIRFTRLSSMANLYGIRFVSLSHQDKIEIEKFVAANAQTQKRSGQASRWLKWLQIKERNA
jgi:CheY-like chemotaxis protein